MQSEERKMTGRDSGQQFDRSDRSGRSGRSGRSVSYYDFSLLFIVICLALFGLVMVYSTTSYSDAAVYGNEWRSTMNHATYLAVFFVVVIFVSNIDYHYWASLSPLMIIVVAGLLVYVLLFGSSANGSSRWIQVGPVTLQPSEFAKPALILFIAQFYYANYSELMRNAKLRVKKVENRHFSMQLPHYKRDWLTVIVAVVSLIIIFLVVIENLSTGIILFLIMFMMMFIANKRSLPYYTWAVLGIIFIGVVIKTDLVLPHLQEYQAARIYAWQNPEAYLDGSGYQILQGLYAVGSGGLTGKGLGSSIQKLGYLPEAQNDMVFAIICEELGLFGALLVLALFGILLWRILFITMNAPDFVGFMISAGIFIHLALQVCFNVAVVTNSMPNTGIGLPFISTGGSALAVCMGELAIVLNISKQIKEEK